MNNIRKKKILRNFIFSLYFLLSLGFEPTYLQSSYLILTGTLTTTLLSPFRFLVFWLWVFDDADYEFKLKINK